MSQTFIILTFLCFTVSSYNNGAGAKPALGWNTWCSFGPCRTDICNQWEIIQVANAMKSNGMYDAGYNRINLDDCWEACNRSSTGEIQADSDRFPDGIKTLSDKIHTLGFKLGLYTSGGSTTCSGGGRKNCHPPGSFGHYVEDANTFASWEIDYVKRDWCGNNLTNPQQQDTVFSNALNATGRVIWLELCRGYGWPPPDYVREVSQSYRLSGDHQDSWSSTATAIHKASRVDFNESWSGPYNWGYSDFLITGGQGCKGDKNPNVTHAHCPGQTDMEYMTAFSIWAISNSPLIIASDVRNMTDIMKRVLLNKDILEVNQNTQYYAGNMVTAVNCENNKAWAADCEVWAKKLSETSAAIVLYNGGNISAHDVTVEFVSIPQMGWTSETVVELKDLWEHEVVGNYTGKYTSSVPVHGVQFLTATYQTKNSP
eukprot:154465_1